MKVTKSIDHCGYLQVKTKGSQFLKHNVNPTIHFCHIRYVCYESNYLFTFVVKKDWTIM